MNGANRLQSLFLTQYLFSMSTVSLTLQERVVMYKIYDNTINPGKEPHEFLDMNNPEIIRILVDFTKNKIVFIDNSTYKLTGKGLKIVTNPKEYVVKYVDSEHFGEGINKMLMTATKTWIKALGFAIINTKSYRYFGNYLTGLMIKALSLNVDYYRSKINPTVSLEQYITDVNATIHRLNAAVLLQEQQIRLQNGSEYDNFTPPADQYTVLPHDEIVKTANKITAYLHHTAY